jgi:hypothetical protein
MTSEILRAVIFGIAIVALIAQFVYDLVQSREKKTDRVNGGKCDLGTHNVSCFSRFVGCSRLSAA